MLEPPHLRIGELSRRSGVSPELLRAWERRYGLLRPQRTEGGLRLYSDADLERVRAMLEYMGEGLAAREAATLAARDAEAREAEIATTTTTARPGRSAEAAADGNGERGGPGPVEADRVVEGDTESAAAGGPARRFDPRAARVALQRTAEAFDEPGAQMAIDDLLAVATVDSLLSAVIVPYLHELGNRWERGEVTVAQEHFASNLVRGRLLGLARGWGRGAGPLAMLACPVGERHDLGLIAFGLALRERGWRIAFLGADTPTESIVDAARTIEPALIVVSATTRERLAPLTSQLAELAQRRRVAVAGAGASGFDAEGVTVLPGDPVTEAERLSTVAIA